MIKKRVLHLQIEEDRRKKEHTKKRKYILYICKEKKIFTRIYLFNKLFAKAPNKFAAFSSQQL